MKVFVLLRRLRGDSDELLGRCERAALAAALHLKRERDAEVVALAVGPGSYEKRMLELARRAGCDRAVDILYAAVDMVDYLGVARVLAAALRREQPDVVLCGGRSQDELVGAVGPAVAELLDLPHLAGVVDLEVTGGDDDALHATRRADGSLLRYRCHSPVVLCIDGFWRARRISPGKGGRDVSELELGELELRASELSVRSDYIGTASDLDRAATIISKPEQLFEQLAGENALRG